MVATLHLSAHVSKEPALGPQMKHRLSQHSRPESRLGLSGWDNLPRSEYVRNKAV
jgi:hypothetical protein